MDTDPYKKIRRQIPPSGYPIQQGKEYRRDRDREKELIKEGLEEYYEEDSLA